MRVLIFHGYLLRGTGSNIYNASLAQALVREGHEVHLLCQDRHARELDFAQAWIAQLEDTQVALTQLRLASQLELGRPDAAVAELQRHGVESVEREVRWLSDLINAEHVQGAQRPPQENPGITG